MYDGGMSNYPSSFDMQYNKYVFRNVLSGTKLHRRFAGYFGVKIVLSRPTRLPQSEILLIL